VEDYRKYVRMFGADIDIREFARLYWERVEGKVSFECSSIGIKQYDRREDATSRGTSLKDCAALIADAFIASVLNRSIRQGRRTLFRPSPANNSRCLASDGE